MLGVDALLLQQRQCFIVLHLHLSLGIHSTNFEMLGSIVGVRSCHVVLLLVCVDLLVLSLVVDRLHFVLIELLLLCLCSLCGSHAIHILIVIDLHLVRQL